MSLEEMKKNEILKKELKSKFPEWLKMNEKDGRGLCLSDDFDSFLSCKLIEKITGMKIKGFYDFDFLYGTEDKKWDLIGVDIDLIKGDCWGNHTTYNYNPNSANINNLLKIGRGIHYTRKFAVSTVLTVISYYNYDISNLSLEAKRLLLAIDSTYLSYKFNKNLCKSYFEKYELMELYEVLESTDLLEFERLKYKYNLKNGSKDAKIWMKEGLVGLLDTDIDLIGLSELLQLDLSLPTEGFLIDEEFEQAYIELKEYRRYIHRKRVYSMAMVNKNHIKLSYYKD